MGYFSTLLSKLLNKLIPVLGKLIGVILPLLSGLGLYGALIGLLVGHFADELLRMFMQKREFREHGTPSLLAGRITTLLWYATPAHMRTGHFVASEIISEFGLTEAETESVLLTIQQLRTAPPGQLQGDVHTLASELRGRLDDDQEVHLVKLLMRLSGVQQTKQKETLRNIQGVIKSLQIPEELFHRYKPVFHDNIKECYMILGLQPKADIKDIKKAYRLLASELHPDTTSALSETQRLQCEATFTRVRQAYEALLEETTE